MFESLSDKLSDRLRKVRGQANISEKNIEEAIKDVRLSLLEADVNFKVVKSFIARVKEKALGTDVLKGVNAGQQFTSIVHEELKEILGKETVPLNFKENPSIFFMVGLQGTGKTTSSAKLALHLRKKHNKKAGLVSVDIYRPAAMDQLKILAKQNDLSYYDSQPTQKPKDIVKEALVWAKKELVDIIIFDTAGRLQIDDELMAEIEELKNMTNPQEVLLVADAMLGQQSVSVAQGFNEKMGLTGLILTKVDGDARGGAALSIRETVGVPIKFLGMGEKVSNLEVFHPDRLASRILDMGDVLSLVEKAQEVVSEKEALETAKKISKNKFTVEDFLSQIQMMKKMGGFGSIMKMMPGMGQLTKQMKGMTPPDDEVKKIEAIIRSMTAKERVNHKILNGSRRLRIANGSGTRVQDVNKFIKQFEQSQKMMSKLMKGGMGKGFPGMGGGLPF